MPWVTVYFSYDEELATKNTSLKSCLNLKRHTTFGCLETYTGSIWNSTIISSKCWRYTIFSLHLPVGSKGKVKSAYDSSDPSGQSSISTPPWMGCQSIAGLPSALNLLVPIYTPGWREALWESSVLLKSQCNVSGQSSNTDCSIQRQAQ